MKVPVLETERLILRPFAQTDEEAVLAIYGDPVVMKFVPLIPLANLAEARAHLQEHLLPVYETPGECLFAICLKEENSPIGYVHVSGDDSHDFGYALRKEFWGHGYATEAALAVLDFVREQGVLYVTAFCLTADARSPVISFMQPVPFSKLIDMPQAADNPNIEISCYLEQIKAELRGE